MVGEDTVLKILKTIGRDKASGLDALSAKFIIDEAVDMHHWPTDPSYQYVDTSQSSPKRVGESHPSAQKEL